MDMIQSITAFFRNLWNAKRKVVLEFVKESGRIALVAALPVAIPMIETGELNWYVIGTVALVAVLKGVDRSLHQTGVAEKGIVRF